MLFMKQKMIHYPVYGEILVFLIRLMA